MGGGMVRWTPFDPAKILKMELIAYLYNLAERQIDVYNNENMPAKYNALLNFCECPKYHSSKWRSTAAKAAWLAVG